MSPLKKSFSFQSFNWTGSHSPVVLFLAVVHENGFESCTGWSGSKELEILMN
jgi:hypothetical protein